MYVISYQVKVRDEPKKDLGVLVHSAQDLVLAHVTLVNLRAEVDDDALKEGGHGDLAKEVVLVGGQEDGRLLGEGDQFVQLPQDCPCARTS